MPPIASKISPLTASTALRTPLPLYLFLSPSRSSIASCAPVEAPDGTAARPNEPSSSRTSTSTVGLPRLSRISRPVMSTISVMRSPCGPTGSQCALRDQLAGFKFAKEAATRGTHVLTAFAQSHLSRLTLAVAAASVVASAALAFHSGDGSGRQGRSGESLYDGRMTPARSVREFSNGDRHHDRSTNHAAECGSHKIAAPAVTGNPEFERAYRVQMNTLEQFVLFLPLFWLATLYFHMVPWLPAVFGLVWIIGRWLYMQGYMAAPEKRGRGFMIAAVANVGLLVMSLVGIVQAWIAVHAT